MRSDAFILTPHHCPMRVRVNANNNHIFVDTETKRSFITDTDFVISFDIILPLILIIINNDHYPSIAEFGMISTVCLNVILVVS